MFPAARRIPLPPWLLALWIIVAAWTFLPDASKNCTWKKFSYSLETHLQKVRLISVNQQDNIQLFLQIASDQTYPVNFCDPDGRLATGFNIGERYNTASNIGATAAQMMPEGPVIQNYINNFRATGNPYKAASDTLRGGPTENAILNLNDDARCYEAV